MKQCSPVLSAIPAFFRTGRTRLGGLPLQLAPYFEADPDPNPPPPPPRTFTQAELDEHVTNRLARERKALEKKYEGVDPDEFSRLRTEEQQRKQKEAEAKQNYDAALRSAQESYTAKEQTWVKTQAELLDEIKTERISNRLLQAAAVKGAVDPGQVAKLLKDRVQLGDDRLPVVLDEHGKPAFKDGKALTTDQLVSDYLDQNPHLAKPAGTSGAGAGGGRSTSGSGPADRNTSPELKAAMDKVAQLEESFKGRRPGVAEMAELQKARRKIGELQKAK